LVLELELGRIVVELAAHKRRPRTHRRVVATVAVQDGNEWVVSADTSTLVVGTPVLASLALDVATATTPSVQSRRLCLEVCKSVLQADFTLLKLKNSLPGANDGIHLSIGATGRVGRTST
jgi:hypothetical protein